MAGLVDFCDWVAFYVLGRNFTSFLAQSMVKIVAYWAR